MRLPAATHSRPKVCTVADMLAHHRPAAATGAYAMPIVASGGSPPDVKMPGHATMWTTQGATSAGWPTQGTTSPGWTTQGATSAGWPTQGTTSAGWTTQGATSAGWTTQGAPSAGWATQRATSAGWTTQGAPSAGWPTQGAESAGWPTQDTTSAGWTTQGAMSAMCATQGATSEGWATQGATSAGWTTLGSTSARSAGTGAPSAMSYGQAPPAIAGIAPALVDSFPQWVMVPQQGGSLLPVTSLAKMASAGRAEGLAGPDQSVHAENRSSRPWESATVSRPNATTAVNPAEAVYGHGCLDVCSSAGRGRDSLQPSQGEAHASPTLSDLDLDFFLPQSSGKMSLQPLNTLLTSQAMRKGEGHPNHDDASPQLMDCPSEYGNTTMGNLANPLPWSSPPGCRSAASPLELLRPLFHSDGTVFAPLAYGHKTGGSSRMLWPLHAGEAQAFSVTSGPQSAAVFGSSFQDMWANESPLGSTRFPPP
jgi:hypothetical protein